MLALIAIVGVALCNLGLGLVVLLKNRENSTNVTFSLFAFILAAWLVFTYYSNDTSLSYNLLVWLNRVTIFLPPIGLYFLLIFSLKFTKLKFKNFTGFAIVFGLTTFVIAIMGASTLVMKSITPLDNVVATNFGVLTPVYSLFIIGEFLAIIAVLFLSVFQQKGAVRARTQIMGASLFLALTITVVTNLILPVKFNNYNYVSLGLLSTIIIVGGFTYAIIRHRLFDIRSVVARSIAYILLLITLGSAYAFITFTIGDLLFSRTNISLPQQTFNVIAALILAFTFQPLQRFFEKITDRVFYRDHYDPQTLLNQLSHILATEIGLVELNRKVRSLLTHQMRVENVNIIVLNNDQIFTESGHYVVSRLEELAHDFGQLRGRIIVADEELDDRRRKVLQQYGVSVLAVLRTKKDKRTGYLLFGPKLSGDIFTNTDLKVISTVTDQLAIAIQNAKAYVEIQQFNQTLRSKVTDATHKLREANENLKQIDVVKDDFLTMASHQLRTPLTVVEGYISNVLDGTYGDLNHKQKDAIKLTQSRVRLTRSLVIDLLNISRMEAGRFFLDLQPTDLNKAVEDEIDNLEVLAKEQAVSMNYTPPKKSVPILTIDDQKIRQVILNLIENALLYSPNSKITISLDSTDNQIIFLVKDNGIGVPKNQQVNLFTKFFRADNAKRERPDGTGIGLYLVKQVIEAHNGHVIFSSDDKKGSTFGFSLPVKTADVLVPKMDEPILAKASA